MPDAAADSQLRLAQQAMDLATAAAEREADTRRHPSPQQGSGEFQAVMLSLVNELKADSREHRLKLETMLVRLTAGDGRMERIELQGDATRDRLSAIESRIAVVEKTGDDTRNHARGIEMRLTAIEAGTSSGIQKAIHHAVVAAKPVSEKLDKRKDSGVGLTVSTSVLLKLIAGLVTVAGAAVGGYFALRQTQVQAATASTAPAPAPSPVVKP
jgi:hypothetical protein